MACHDWQSDRKLMRRKATPTERSEATSSKTLPGDPGKTPNCLAWPTWLNVQNLRLRAWLSESTGMSQIQKSKGWPRSSHSSLQTRQKPHSCHRFTLGEPIMLPDGTARASRYPCHLKPTAERRPLQVEASGCSTQHQTHAQ